MLREFWVSVRFVLAVCLRLDRECRMISGWTLELFRPLLNTFLWLCEMSSLTYLTKPTFGSSPCWSLCMCSLDESEWCDESSPTTHWRELNSTRNWGWDWRWLWSGGCNNNNDDDDDDTPPWRIEIQEPPRDVYESGWFFNSFHFIKSLRGMSFVASFFWNLTDVWPSLTCLISRGRRSWVS